MFQRRRSLFLLLSSFWMALTLQRFWYFATEYSIYYPPSVVARVLVRGFIQDGAILASLIFLLQLIYSWIVKLSSPWYHRLYVVCLMVVSVLLSLILVNTEYFRYFGSNSNFDHLTLLLESDDLAPSLKAVFTWDRTSFYLFTLVSFVILNISLNSWKIDHFFKLKRARFVIFLFCVAGLAAPSFPKEKQRILANLAENYFVSVGKALYSEVAFKSATHIPIHKIFDNQPLPHPTVATQLWYDVDPQYPLIKATGHHLCSLGIWDEKKCSVDEDADGVPLSRDCHDREARIHPGAFDIPGNGIDEDCSGMDANPPNIILIHWEGARAVNVGSIGYSTPCTPRFDALAKKGLLFRQAYSNGVQTRFSLTSIYNSILPRLSSKWIFKHNPSLNLLAFPMILKNFGYQTLYIHSGDINFGNFKSWFWQWFDVMIDKTTEPIKGMKKVGWGIPDRDLFSLTYDLLKNRQDPRPFFITIQTLSLHHPFTIPEKKFEAGRTEYKYRVPNILRYTDDALGDFVEKILNDPKFNNTLFLITSDHGLNWFEPHAGTQYTLWDDQVWIPMLLLGDRWNVKPGTNDEIRQLLDIGPTILDRLGIEVPHHFVGQSLLRSYQGRENRAYFGTAEGGLSAGIRDLRYKYFVSFKYKEESLFDMSVDRQEKKNLWKDPEFEAIRRERMNILANVYSQNNKLIKENRIWNWKYWTGPKGNTKQEK